MLTLGHLSHSTRALAPTSVHVQLGQLWACSVLSWPAVHSGSLAKAGLLSTLSYPSLPETVSQKPESRGRLAGPSLSLQGCWGCGRAVSERPQCGAHPPPVPHSGFARLHTRPALTVLSPLLSPRSSKLSSALVSSLSAQELWPHRPVSQC